MEKIMNPCWQSFRFLILPWAFFFFIKKKKKQTIKPGVKPKWLSDVDSYTFSNEYKSHQINVSTPQAGVWNLYITEKEVTWNNDLQCQIWNAWVEKVDTFSGKWWLVPGRTENHPLSRLHSLFHFIFHLKNIVHH